MQFVSISGLVYLLCGATSLGCGLLLVRGYRQTHVRLLFWSSLCFFGMTLENLLLYVDRIVIPDVDLSVVRRLPGLLAVMLLIYGLIFEDDRR